MKLLPDSSPYMLYTPLNKCQIPPWWLKVMEVLMDATQACCATNLCVKQKEKKLPERLLK